MGIGIDGKTVWYTSKATGTLGRIIAEGKVETFALSTVGTLPNCSQLSIELSTALLHHAH